MFPGDILLKYRYAMISGQQLESDKLYSITTILGAKAANSTKTQIIPLLPFLTSPKQIAFNFHAVVYGLINMMIHAKKRKMMSLHTTNINCTSKRHESKLFDLFLKRLVVWLEKTESIISF